MAFFLNWFNSLLGFFGLYRKSAKIVLLGLDDAGKTTLLHMLRDNHLTMHNPTQMPTMEELTIGSIRFRTYDMGGHAQARKLWRDYLVDVNAVVYLVDCSNPDRFAESKKELDQLLIADELRNAPFVVLGNKIDSPKAVSEAVLREQFGLELNTFEKAEGERPLELFMCAVAKRIGYMEAFNWLAQLI